MGIRQKVGKKITGITRPRVKIVKKSGSLRVTKQETSGENRPGCGAPILFFLIISTISLWLIGR